MTALALVRREWRAFRTDRPGERFRNQWRRLHNGSHRLMVAQAIVGFLLVVSGLVLLFAPGPGLLLIVFGLALIAGLSRRLARVLDRLEPRARVRARRARGWWESSPVALKLGLGVVAAAVTGAALYAMYALWLA